MTNNGDRKNDIRQIIRTLKAGEPITESWLKAVSDALNERRPFSNPPTQVFRNPVGTAGVIKFASWCVISLASPTSNLLLNSTSSALTASSDKQADFSGTAAAKKILLNFEKSIQYTASLQHIAYLGHIVSPYNKVVVNYTGTAAGNGNMDLASLIRVTPITASFVTASQTWNNYGSLTLGAPFSNLNSTSFVSGVSSFQTTNGGTGSCSGIQYLETFTTHVTMPSSGSIYGIVIEVCPDVFGDSLGSYTVTSESAELNVKFDNTPFLMPRALTN